MTPYQKVQKERRELADRFNAFIEQYITLSRKADGSINRDKYGLARLDDVGKQELNLVLEDGLASWCDEFRRGECTNVGTVRIAIAVKRLFRALDMEISND